MQEDRLTPDTEVRQIIAIGTGFERYVLGNKNKGKPLAREWDIGKSIRSFTKLKCR